MGFEFMGSLDGSDPIIMEFEVNTANTVAVGTMVSITSGKVAVSATDDSAIAGVAVSGGTAGDMVGVIINPNAVYAVPDANARSAGASLDLATGARGLAAASNNDVVVYANSTAGEKTRVVIASGSHFLR